MEFSLTLEDIIIPEFCPVFGIRLESGFGMGRGIGLDQRDRAPSVDRIDNAKGYTKDNIIIVSYRANRLKSDARVEEIETLAKFYRSLSETRNVGSTGT